MSPFESKTNQRIFLVILVHFIKVMRIPNVRKEPLLMQDL